MTSFYRHALILGLLAATNPFAINVYLPALPNIAAELQASAAGIQASIAAYIAAVALTQLGYGPVSDMFGRRMPLLFGLGVFALASLGCVLAPSIGWLIFFRFLQGLGSCAAVIIPRAIVRDLHHGIEGARLLALMMLVSSVAPVLAPLMGSYLLKLFSWRGTFAFIGLLSLVSMAIVVFVLPETRPPERRIRLSPLGVAAAYRQLVCDRHYLGVCLAGASGMACFFSYLATSSFVYMDHFGLDPQSFSIAFSSVSVGFFGAAQLTPFWAGRYGFRRVVIGATIGLAATTSLLALLVGAGIDSLPLIITGMIISMCFLGTVTPCTAVLALEHHGAIAGMAAGMFGSMQMFVAAAAMAVLGMVFDGSPRGMTLAIACCALASLAVCWLTFARPRPAPQPAE